VLKSRRTSSPWPPRSVVPSVVGMMPEGPLPLSPPPHMQPCPRPGSQAIGSHRISSLLVVPVLAFSALQLSGCLLWFQQPPAAETEGSSCRWPLCAMSCDACPERRVGKCLSKLLGLDLRYMCNTNITKCLIGRCVCKQGYCAGKYTMEGLSQADPSRLRTCDKQVCYKGARPPVDHPTLAVHIFASLAPAAAYREAFDLRENYMKYIILTSITAGVLFLAGLIITVLTWICLCAGHTGCKGACGVEVNWYIWGHQHQAFDCVDLPSDGELDLKLENLPLEELKRLKPNAVPSVWPIIKSTLSVATLCALCVAIREHNQTKFTWSVHDTLLHVYEDSKTLANNAIIVNQTLVHIGQVLNDIQDRCYLTDPVLQTSTKDVTDLLNVRQAEVGRLLQLFIQTPPKLLEIREFVHTMKPYEVWVPVIPQMIVGLFCVLLSLPALIVRFCGRSRTTATCLAHVFDLFLLWLSPLTVLIILSVTICAAGLCSFGIAASVICLDEDHYAMHYAERYAPGELALGAARHYVQGDVANPITGTIDESVMLVDQIVDLYKEFKVLVDVIGWSCLPLFDVDVPKLAETARGLMAEGRRLTSANNIWPYYHQVVQDEFCHQVVTGCGWMVLFQVTVCLILFPMAVLKVHHFLLRKEEYMAKSELIDEAVKTRIARRVAVGEMKNMGSSISETDTSDESSDIG